MCCSIMRTLLTHSTRMKYWHVASSGVMVPPIEQVTAQGYDLQFGTNVIGVLSHNFRRISQPDIVLGHFYFTTLLIPALLAGAKSSPDGKARVLNTSSFASLLNSGVDFNTLKDTPARKKCADKWLYSQSKLVGISAYTQTVPFITRSIRVMCCFQMNYNEDTGTRASFQHQWTLETWNRTSTGTFRRWRPCSL